MNDFYRIRDEIIPSCTQEKELERFLEKNILASREIYALMGQALYSKNVVAIALLNQSIRENGYQLFKFPLIDNIYYAECRELSWKYRDSLRISFGYLDRRDDENFENRYALTTSFKR
jgi:hypothetical protein